MVDGSSGDLVGVKFEGKVTVKNYTKVVEDVLAGKQSEVITSMKWYEWFW